MCLRTITTAFKTIYCHSACVCVAQRAALESVLPSHLRCAPRLNAGVFSQMNDLAGSYTSYYSDKLLVTKINSLVCWIFFFKAFLSDWFLS